MIFETREVLSANSFALLRNPRDKSLMQTRKSSRPKIENCGTPALLETISMINHWEEPSDVCCSNRCKYENKLATKIGLKKFL